jgi:hypothetical protein
MRRPSSGHFTLISVLIPLLFVAQINGASIDRYNEELSDEKAATNQPQILSNPVNVDAYEGESVSLPCEIEDLGEFVVLWSKGPAAASVGSAILFAGNTKVFAGTTYKVHHPPNSTSHTLIISEVDLKDAGEFTCKVSTNPPIEVVHKISVAVRKPPPVEVVHKVPVVGVSEEGMDPLPEGNEIDAVKKPDAETSQGVNLGVKNGPRWGTALVAIVIYTFSIVMVYL